eukprot:Gb_19661 [translate_table: standard]
MANPHSSMVDAGHEFETVLTVCKKALFFTGTGFMVTDSNGNMVFRVESYGSSLKEEVVIMDGAGRALLTLRHKNQRLSLYDRWEGFYGELAGDHKPKPSFSVKRLSKPAQKLMNSKKQCGYKIEGSFCNRDCTIYSGCQSLVAQIKRKQATSEVMLEKDVFSLVVQPGFDQAFVVGMIVILDHVNTQHYLLKLIVDKWRDEKNWALKLGQNR